MAEYRTYAEVLTPSHPQQQAYAQGLLSKEPGRLLEAVLEETGGVYEFHLQITDDVKAQLRELAAISPDKQFQKYSAADEVVISLEHLRGLDPSTTRVVIGQGVHYSYEEARRLNKKDPNFQAPGN